MELEKRVEDIMKHSEEKDQKIKEISERLTLKETEVHVYSAWWTAIRSINKEPFMLLLHYVYLVADCYHH